MLIDPGNFLLDLHWQTRLMVQKVAKDFHAKTGRALKLRSGLRSCTYQNSLYAQGRTTAGQIVTNAPGCRSWHTTGRAVDFDPFDPLTGSIPKSGNHEDYRLAGEIWKKEGGVWGGDFENLFDPGHLEWHPGMSINDVCPPGTTCDKFVIPQRFPTYLAASASAAGILLVWGLFALAKR